MNDLISIIIPVHNESKSLPNLLSSLSPGLQRINAEVLFIDDGSTDDSFALLTAHAKAHPDRKVLRLLRRYGQTAAMSAGFEAARGGVIVCMDADGQNDPADIPSLLAEIKNGADVVSGWRRFRQDFWLTRVFPSKVANWLISWVTGIKLHDYGCTLKAYKREFLQDLRLYGEMHRFLPAWCAWHGARIVEVAVRHHPRTAGRSKVGAGRTFKVLLDLMTAKFFFSYLNKPNYVFGGAGLILICASFAAGLFPILDKFVFDHWGHLRIPFMIFSVFLGLLGAQFVVLGLLGEILVRLYYESLDRRPYLLAKDVNNAA